MPITGVEVQLRPLGMGCPELPGRVDVALILGEERVGVHAVNLYRDSVWPWPDGVPVQVHGMDADPFFAEDEGDIDSARELVATHPERAELYLYPGDRHLFADRSLSSHDPEARALLTRRTLELSLIHISEPTRRT